MRKMDFYNTSAVLGRYVTYYHLKGALRCSGVLSVEQADQVQI